MAELREIELIFEPLEEGGYHVYAPDLPGFHTQGDDIETQLETPRRPWPSTWRDFARTAERLIRA